MEQLKRLFDMKGNYEEQVNKLKNDWKNGNSKFSNVKDYKIQLNIWEKRIAQYDEQIRKFQSFS